MLACYRIEELAELGQPLHLAIGVFDGVHLGHQAVIAKAVEAANREGGLAGLLTFDPHPIRVIAPERAPASLLETLAHKSRVVAGLGIELFVPLRFDAAMAKMDAQVFIRRLAQAPLRTVAVGVDWRFGHQRIGDVALLEHEARRGGFRLDAVAPVMFKDDRISSTRIRQAVHDGNLREASLMLGRVYSVCGPVIEGAQLGRQLGFPTANIHTGNLQLPPHGVWAVRIMDDHGQLWNGVANLGVRPTLKSEKIVLEAHLFEFSGDLYGDNLEVFFVKHLRPEIKFASLDALKDQISSDVLAAKEALA